MTKLRTLLWSAGGVVVIAGVVSGALMVAANQSQVSDAGSMASKASQVMPFDLTKTTHTFTKSSNGGVEKVVINDSTDTRDEALIRSHLSKEAALFRKGNYSDPTMIHGMDMPGVKELSAGTARVTVDYTDIDGGAQITYSSADPNLVSAIHAWFDRQVTDHGMPGMGG